MSKLIIFILLIAVSTYAELTPIDNYFGFIGELVEKRLLNDEHLMRMIEAAEQGLGNRVNSWSRR